MRRAFLWVPWLLLFGSSFAIGQVAASSDGKTTEAPSAPEQIAAKQARLSAIIAELRGRRLVGWSMAKLARRAGSLDLLEAYARRGEFTVHHELWPRDQPLFIDDQGTRCALAHVLDGVGEDALVVALAERCNDAYLNEIDDDPVLLSVLDQLGLTLDEAAYIQGPGIGGPRGTDTGSREDRQERRQERQERRERREERERRRDERGGGNDGGGNDGGGNDGGGNDGGGNDGGGNDGGGGNDDGGNDGPQTGGRLPPPVTGGDKGSLATGGAPSGPPPTAGTRAGVTGVSRRSQATPTFTVDGWWSANLDRFLPVREIYRGGVALTPQAMTESLALSAAEHAALREQLRAVAVADVDLRATALGMWARTSSGDDAAAIVEATAQFLADPGQPHREWAPVLLAMLENPAASPLLQSLVADDAEGRRRLGKSSAVPESMRALAALALGKCGDAVPTLKAALRDQPAAHVDLAAACVVGLGLAARRPAEQYAATVALLGALDDEALPATVRAQVPVALALADAQAALPRLFDVVQRFRGPRELRAACAHALGRLAPALDATLFDGLLALAKRDVDVEARQAAIVALGELAAKSGTELDAVTARTLAALLVDGVQGRLRHAADVPWHAVAAGLFVRGGHAAAADLLPRLRELAAEGAAQDARAAALLALGLARDGASLPLFQAELAQDSVTSTRLHAIHALGLLGARNERAALLALCMDAPDPLVGHAAAFALGCLADPRVIAPMVEALGATRSDAVRAALARALGEIGDRRALEGLSELAFAADRDDPTRERALAALGVLGQRGGVSWNAPLRHALFLGEAPPTLQFVSSLF